MSDLTLHVHNDIDILKKRYSIVSVGGDPECYIMQGNKVIFIGSIKQADYTIRCREGEDLPEIDNMIYRLRKGERDE